MEGWIKVHRKLVDWEWYNDINVKVVFLHLLLTANHKEKQWKGAMHNGTVFFTWSICRGI